MTALQWALLVLSFAIVVAVVVISRREREPAPRRPAPAPARPGPAARSEGSRQQLDIFESAPLAGPSDGIDEGTVSPPRAAQAQVPVPVPVPVPAAALTPRRPESPVEPVPAAPVPPPVLTPAEPVPPASPLGNQQFDEFGVGKPRRRTSPALEVELPPPGAAAPAQELPIAPWLKAGSGATGRRVEPEPVVPPPPAVPAAPAVVAAPTVPPPAPAAPPAPVAPAVPPTPPKIVSLLLVERDGGTIAGSKLHAALAAQGLQFGAKQIYHRMVRGEAVFSVASLVKPGVLLPEAAAQFATPGLQVFMVLPGPVKPLTALHDMLSTTQALARALNAEAFDSRKQALTSESLRALQADVEAWARAAGL